MVASRWITATLGSFLLCSTAGAADPVEEKASQADEITADQKVRADEVPDFARMRAPASPAFTLLGASPSQVERPSTPSDVVASLGSTLSAGSSGLIPDGVALEVAPYWLFPSWGLTWDDYNRQWWAGFYRAFSLSVATVTSSLPASDPASYSDLATGARTQLLMGRPRNDCVKAVDEYRKLAKDLTRAQLVPDDVEQKLREQYGFGTDAYRRELAKYQAERRKPFDQRMPKVYEACDAAGRVGLVLDAAGAFAWRFTQSDASRGHRESGAAWITASYLADAWSVVAMGRFDARDLAASPDRSLDAGLRAIVQQARYAASLEGVIRRTYHGDVGTRYRLAIIAEYRLVGETWASVSFGRDDLVSDLGSLFTTANLKWGFGAKGFEAKP